MWGRQWGVGMAVRAHTGVMGCWKLESSGKSSFLNITMMFALEPSVGTAESSRLTSASLLPLLSAAQDAGMRPGDRQALRVREWQQHGVLACIFQLGSWGQQSIFISVTCALWGQA